MKNRKIIKTILITLIVTLVTSVPVFAGTWKSDDKGWWFQKADGNYPADTWQEINHNWYSFNSEGYMQTGWIQSENQWYYCNLNGILQTGWIQNAGKWYYGNDNGSLATNQWIDGMYYVGADGAMYVDAVTPDGIAVDSSGKKLDSSMNYDQYIGEYSDLQDYEAEHTYLSLGLVQTLSIEKISDGKIYGKFNTGYTEMYDEDFSMGVNLSNNKFTTNGVTQYWEKGDSKPYKIETYTANYELTVINGTPVIVKNGEIIFYLIK